MVWMGVPAALSNRLWARLCARNAVSSFMVFSKSARCSSLKGCTYLMIITSSGRGEYATQSGLTLMRYCISIVSKNFWSGTYLVAIGLIAAGYADFPLIAYHFQKTSLASERWI